MSKPAFTPGPWSWMRGLEPYSDQHTLSPGVLIANGTDGTPDGDAIDRANAHLIAAAPDMYEALQATLLFHSASPWDCEKQNRWRELTGKDEASTLALCDLVRSALAKAEGRSA